MFLVQLIRCIYQEGLIWKLFYVKLIKLISCLVAGYCVIPNFHSPDQFSSVCCRTVTTTLLWETFGHLFQQHYEDNRMIVPHTILLICSNPQLNWCLTNSAVWYHFRTLEVLHLKFETGRFLICYHELQILNAFLSDTIVVDGECIKFRTVREKDHMFICFSQTTWQCENLVHIHSALQKARCKSSQDAILPPMIWGTRYSTLWDPLNGWTNSKNALSHTDIQTGEQGRRRIVEMCFPLAGAWSTPLASCVSGTCACCVGPREQRHVMGNNLWCKLKSRVNTRCYSLHRQAYESF